MPGVVATASMLTIGGNGRRNHSGGPVSRWTTHWQGIGAVFPGTSSAGFNGQSHAARGRSGWRKRVQTRARAKRIQQMDERARRAGEKKTAPWPIACTSTVACAAARASTWPPVPAPSSVSPRSARTATASASSSPSPRRSQPGARASSSSGRPRAPTPCCRPIRSTPGSSPTRSGPGGRQGGAQAEAVRALIER